MLELCKSSVRNQRIFVFFLFLISFSFVVSADIAISLDGIEEREEGHPFVQTGDTTTFDIDSADLDNVCDINNSTLFRWAGIWGCGEFNMSDFVVTIISENHTYIEINSSTYWNNVSSFNTTQMEDNNGVLNILESWITSIVNSSLWFSSGGVTQLFNPEDVDIGSNEFKAQDGNFTRDLSVMYDLFVYDDTTLYDTLKVYGISSFYKNFNVYNDSFFNTSITLERTGDAILEIETLSSDSSAELRMLADGTNDLYIYTYGSTAAATYYGYPRANTSYIDARGERLIIGTFDTSPMYLATDTKTRFVLTSAGHLIPEDDESYDIGNNTNRIRDIYVLGEDGLGGLHFVEDDGSYGNLSMDDDFNLLWNGNILANINGTIEDSAAWITMTSLQAKWFADVGNVLTFDETELNKSIDERTASTTYNATSIATIEGTLDAGNLASVLSIDNDFYNVSEDAGGSPLLIEINFTGVVKFSNILMRERYIGGGQGHDIEVQSWNYDSSAWEVHSAEITDQSTMVEHKIDVLDGSDHISGGLVQVRIDHLQNGISSHDFFLNFIALQEGFTSLTNADHDSLFGRGSTDNHPWALPRDGSKNMTGQLNGTSALFTENATFEKDVIIEGTLYGGSPVKIAGGLIVDGGNVNISPDYNFTSGYYTILNEVGSYLDELLITAKGAIRYMDENETVDVMFLNVTSGYVGIGTITPSATLNVVGDMNITGDFLVGDERIFVDESYTALQSPTQNHYLSVDNTGAFYDGSEILTVSNQPDIDKIVSPDTLKDLAISNINLLYSDGSYARLYIDDTEARLTSPDGQSKSQVKDGDFNFYDGTRDRIEADGIGTTLRSTTGAYVSLLSNDFLFSDNTRSRIIVSDAESRLASPDGTNALIMSDASAYITSALEITGNTAITGAITTTSSGTAITSIDSIAGVGLSVKQSSADKHTIIDFFEEGATRKGWFGYGSSSYRHNIYIFNDYADGNIVLIPRNNIQAGEVDVIGEFSVTGVAGSGKVVCVKADGNFGVCSSAISGSGTCTCG